MLSKKAKALKPSPTLAMAAKARELQTQGHKVISLTVGEPDWPTFPAAVKAGIESINKEETKYSAAAGLPELREQIARWTSQQLGVSYTAAETVVGPGAKFVIYNVLQMIIDEGDEVIIPAPYWVSYPAMTELAGGIPVTVDVSPGKVMASFADMAKKITPRTKAIIICSPSNPTGMMYSSEELAELAEILRKNPKVILISDDIYNRLVFTGGPVAPHILQRAPELKSQVVVVNGASKSFSMTGWRVGWALGDSRLMKAMADFNSQTTSNVPVFSQRAALKALTDCESDILKSCDLLKTRLTLARKAFKEFDYFQMHEPQGAFYLWVGVDRIFGKKYEGQVLKNSSDIANVLLEKIYVATVPGIEFGAEGFLRLSFAASEASLQEAFLRMKNFEKSLS